MLEKGHASIFQCVGTTKTDIYNQSRRLIGHETDTDMEHNNDYSASIEGTVIVTDIDLAFQ